NVVRPIGGGRDSVPGEPGICAILSFQPPAGNYLAATTGFQAAAMPETPPRTARTLEISIFDARRNLPLYVLTAHGRAILDLAYRPEGRRLATADAGGTVLVWEPSPGKPAATARTYPCRVRALALHPDGRQLAAVGEDGIVRLDDLDSASPRVERKGRGFG